MQENRWRGGGRVPAAPCFRRWTESLNRRQRASARPLTFRLADVVENRLKTVASGTIREQHVFLKVIQTPLSILGLRCAHRHANQYKPPANDAVAEQEM
jgi:hypothetical protein